MDMDIAALYRAGTSRRIARRKRARARPAVAPRVYRE